MLALRFLRFAPAVPEPNRARALVRKLFALQLKRANINEHDIYLTLFVFKNKKSEFVYIAVVTHGRI